MFLLLTYVFSLSFGTDPGQWAGFVSRLHKHINPENILIKDNAVFLSGFNFYGETGGTNDGYDAPEVGKQICTRRADIYSLGCVFKDLFSFRYDDILHSHRDSTSQGDALTDGSLIELFSSSSDNGSAEIVKLIKEKMTQVNPNSRPTAVLVMKSIVKSAKQIPWFHGHDAIKSEELNYPDLSEDIAYCRRKIFNWNLDKKDGPFLIEQIYRDLEENTEEMIVEHKRIYEHFNLLRRTGNLGICIWN